MEEIISEIDKKFIYKDNTLYRVYKNDRLKEVLSNVNNTVKVFNKQINIPRIVWYINTSEWIGDSVFGFRDNDFRNCSFDNLINLWDDGNTLTTERLNELFDYNPETGILIRKYAMPGGAAGILRPNQSNGYIALRLFGKQYLAHRLIWIMQGNELDDDLVIDHIDHNSSNNSISNLRLITRMENAKNMKRKNTRDLPIGIQKTVNGRYKARIDSDGTMYNVGTYDTVGEATAAWNAAKQALGFHENHGK